MAAQVALPLVSSSTKPTPPTISLPSTFKIDSQDSRLEQKTNTPTDASAVQPPPLGVLANFTGTFAGTGFNSIFRPDNGQTFPNISSDNVLELNLTTETLSFSSGIGNVPNRGSGTQSDIFLNGVPYVQAINDVSNTATGKADAKPSAIHFEPGLWMHVPATTNDPVLGESLVRMGSIPHGTTINAQCLAPTSSIAGPPTIPPVDMTPFLIGTSNKIPFPSQTASNENTPRLPQDLTKFIAAGTITQAVLNDPNTVLRNAIDGQKITKTTVFTVSTTPTTPELGGGTANIAFLLGAAGANPAPNADAIQMSATFWIEEVQHNIVVPVYKPGEPPLKIAAPASHPGAPVPTFLVDPPHEITAPKTISVTSTQIQYSQKVVLNFAGLSWPHISCATLIPEKELPVPVSAYD